MAMAQAILFVIIDLLVKRAGLQRNSSKTGMARSSLPQHRSVMVDKGIPFLFLDWKRTGRHLLPQLKGKASVYTPGRPRAGRGRTAGF